MMRELSDILTPGKGPTFNKEQYEEEIKRNPNAGFNPNWDTRRAWLISYAEKNHAVKIKGGAKSDEDVAEFLKRLKVSAFFSRRLLAADAAGDRHQAERLVRDVRRDVPGELLMQNFFDRIAALPLAVEARHHRRARGRAHGRRLLVLLLRRHARRAGAAGAGRRRGSRRRRTSTRSASRSTSRSATR